MYFIVSILHQTLVEELEQLNCDDLTRAHIINIFTGYITPINDLSKQSITLSFAEAKSKQDFIGFERVGNWIFLCHSLYPEHLRHASIEYYQSIGRLSYYKCFQLLNKKWRTFELLADEFVPLSMSCRTIIRQL
jgi:hypothetical protein